MHMESYGRYFACTIIIVVATSFGGLFGAPAASGGSSGLPVPLLKMNGFAAAGAGVP